MKLLLFFLLIVPFCLSAQQWEKVGNLSSVNNIGGAAIPFKNSLYFYGGVKINNKRYDFGKWNGREWNFIDTADSRSGAYSYFAQELSTGPERLVMKKRTAFSTDSVGIISYDGKEWKTLYHRYQLPEFQYISTIRQIGSKIYLLYVKDTLYNSQVEDMYDIVELDGPSIKIIPVKLIRNDIDCWIHVVGGELYLNLFYASNTWTNGKPLKRLNKWNGTDWEPVGDSEPHNDVNALITYNGNLVCAGKNYDGAISSGVQVLSTINNEWVSIAGTQMTGEITEMIEHKGKLYANEGNKKLWVYNGVNWTQFADYLQFRDTVNAPFNQPFFGSTLVYKDELYVLGDFHKVNGEEIYDLAKTPLLNDSNTRPDAVMDRDTLLGGDSLEIAIKANDTDAEGDYLFTSIKEGPKHGIVTITDGDELIYKPDANYNGGDTVYYKVCDLGGLCDSALVYINVLPEGAVSMLPGNVVTLYPNPAKETLYLRFEELINGEVRIYNLAGKELLNQPVNGSDLQISLSTLKPGLYIIRLISDKGAFQQKFIKQ